MTSHQVIDTYLAQVAAGLPGPARARADVLAELRSGLLDAADTHRLAGLPAGAAHEAAVREFGDPRQVAAAFRPELAITQARRHALTLATGGLLTGLRWAHAAQASHPAISRGPLWRWAMTPPVPFAASAFLIAALAALGVAAVTGPVTRWLPRRPRAAATSAAIGGYAAAATDMVIFILLAHQLATAPSALDPVPVIAATAASLARLALARRAARHCLTARAALT